MGYVCTGGAPIHPRHAGHVKARANGRGVRVKVKGDGPNGREERRDTDDHHTTEFIIDISRINEMKPYRRNCGGVERKTMASLRGVRSSAPLRGRCPLPHDIPNVNPTGVCQRWKFKEAHLS